MGYLKKFWVRLAIVLLPVVGFALYMVPDEMFGTYSLYATYIAGMCTPAVVLGLIVGFLSLNWFAGILTFVVALITTFATIKVWLPIVHSYLQ